MQIDEIYRWEECGYEEATRSEVGQYHDGSRWKRGCHCLVKRHRRLVKIDPKPEEIVPEWMAIKLCDNGAHIEVSLGGADSWYRMGKRVANNRYRVAKESNNG